MRLLQLRDNGDFSLVEHVGKEIPPYAILSHTWGADKEEVSFKDLIEGIGKNKAGYRKLVFCANQAAQDGLQFFWVDTCSIDKSSSAELSEAINSMFQWYSRAEKCYVYLSDVSITGHIQGDQSSQNPWRLMFRHSRWFTRGWTLQELLAPKAVEFFSADGDRLGDKISLIQEIQEATGICAQAIQGSPLSQFTVPERMLWAESRKTTREEDAVYALLGIFDVYMPPLYGEGRGKALARLYREIEYLRLGKPLPSSTVPFRRDDDFISRDILDKIRQVCARPASRAALVGLGGVGKSQLAIEYAYQIRDASPTTWVFWVHAGTRARFEEGYRRIAEATKMDGWNNPKADFLRLVRSWLCDESNGRWLIVLDNADDSSVLFQNASQSHSTVSLGQAVELLSDYLPQSPNGSILITSRSQGTAYKLIGTYTSIIEVEPMDKDDALALLKRKLDVISNEDDAIKLINTLDALPLAITQAAAFIKQRATRMSISKYVDEVCRSDHSRGRLLSKDVGDTRRDGQASNSILTTWQISFEHIRACAPTAANLLSLMSLFDRQGIPESLLREVYKRDGKSDDDGNFDDDIDTLTNYSLVEINAGEQEFKMHRLVQFATKKWLELQGNMEEWKTKYIMLIDNNYPTAQYENWKVCQILLPHVLASLDYRPVDGVVLERWASILYKAAQYLNEMGDYQTAQVLNLKALESMEALLGEEHPKTIACISSLAVTYCNQGRWKEDEELEVRVLKLSKRVLGEEHPSTLTSISNLGVTYLNLGRWEEAEQLFLQVIEVKKRILGEEHPSTISSISHLGATYKSLGRWEEAEQLFLKVIEVRKRILGEEHPDTTSNISLLASIYQNQARSKEAEELVLLVMEARKKILGEEHPRTLDTVYSLACIYQDDGRSKGAEELLLQVLEARNRILGEEHPDTLDTVHSLASIYQDNGRSKEAEELLLQVIEARKRVLGEEHPDTLSAVHSLASIYQGNGRGKEAEELLLQVIKARKRIRGEEHPRTLATVQSLASIYQNQARSKEAEELLLQVMEARKRILGEEHPRTLDTVESLASIYQDQARSKEAEVLLLQVLEAKKRMFGEEHLDTLATIQSLAYIYQNQARSKEAEVLLLQVMEARKRILGEEHPSTLASITNLASTYYYQGRWKETEDLEVQVIETRKRINGEEHPETLACMNNLATTYRNQGRWKEAQELWVQVLDSNRRILGEEHPGTLKSMHHLASTYRNQGRLKEAEELEVQVMEKRRKIFGEEHPDTLKSMHNLSLTYCNQGKWKEAEELEMLVMETRKRVLGDEHPSTLASMANLARTWNSQNRSKEAISLIMSCLHLQRKVHGPHHPSTESSIEMLNTWEKESMEAKT